MHKGIAAIVATWALAFCSAVVVTMCSPAYAGINDKPRTTCEQDMVFTAMFAHPAVSQQELDRFVEMVQPGDRDQAIWGAIADTIAMYQKYLGRDFTDAEVDLLVKQVERQCYDAKGV